MQVDDAHAIWNDWRDQALNEPPAQLLNRLVAQAGADAAFVHGVAGILDADSWLNFGPFFVGLTLGARDLDPHPLSEELADSRCEVLGYLFDPVTLVPSWEVVTFLLGTAIARQRLHLDVARICFSRRGAISSEDKATLILLAVTLQPTMALEAGTFEGGTTEMLARLCGHVVTIDWEPKAAAHVATLDNVTFVCGRAADRIGGVLTDHPDTSLVFLDADHRNPGVAEEVTAVLEAPTPTLRLIAVHDAAEAECRAGLLSVRWNHPAVVRVSLGLISGHPDGNGFGGLGLVLVSCKGTGSGSIVRVDVPRTARWPHTRLAAPDHATLRAAQGLWRRSRSAIRRTPSTERGDRGMT